MHRLVQTGSTLTLAAALALLAGCTSGNNNSNNKATTAATQAAATVATAATPRSATPAVALRTSTPAGAATTIRTATPGAGTVRTATPSAATPVRTTTPPAAAALRTATPAAGAAVSTPGASTPSTDAALLKSLTDAALKDADLPAGYTAQGDPDTTVNLPGETAGYTVTFLNVSKIPQITAVALLLGGFKDTQTATSDFASIQQSVASQAGGDFKLTSVANGPKVGDEAQSFQISGTTSGITLGGYVIVWRRGRITAGIALLGSPAVQSIDDVTPLAQKQDDRLKSVSQ